jgi:pyridoxine kinase
MNILSIQSHVAYGHVGNAAAVFPLQRIGVEVWPIHTVQFSNHPGYGSWTGESFQAASIRDIVRGISDRGVLARCAGVLSGYLGAADIGEAVLEAVADVKRANPAALFCCDPVMGDAGRMYVREGVPEFFRHQAVPAADIVTPNHFELEYLASRKVASLADARAAIASVHALGPRVILVTSLGTAETPPDAVDLIVSGPEGFYRLRTPKLPIQPNGAGDAVAALFFAHYLRSGSAAEAMSRSASAIFGVLARTAEAGEREMILVAAQNEIVSPSRIFEAVRLGH